MRATGALIVAFATIVALFYCATMALAGFFAITAAGRIEALCWANLAGLLLVLYEVRKGRGM